MKQSYVYIMGNARPTLYVGVTSDLLSRVYRHREKLLDGFTKQYDLTKLLYFEQHDAIEDAILREKQLKRWNRIWKLQLIQGQNPGLIDLYPGLIDSRFRGNDAMAVMGVGQL